MLRRSLSLLVIALPLLSACAASSPYLVPTPGYKVAQPSEGMAQVVFVRPSSYAKKITVTIIDEQLKYMGEGIPGAHFATPVTPGEHLFVAWGEGTHALKINAEAGKTYYVEVAPVMGVWSARFHLKAIKSGTENYNNLQKWLAETKPLELKQQDGQAKVVDKRQENAKDALRKGQEVFANYNEQEKNDRTLDSADGV